MEILPSDYLKGGPRGLDLEHYGNQFSKKLLTDYRLAQDGDFRARYINGYEFPAVPRFRQDAASWDGFVRSWCESVALEAGKRSPRSFLAQKIIAVAAEFNLDVDLEAEKIKNWLRKSWEHEVCESNDLKTLGAYLTAYHVERRPAVGIEQTLTIPEINLVRINQKPVRQMLLHKPPLGL